MRHLLYNTLICLCSSFALSSVGIAQPQIVLNTDLSPEELVVQYLVGTGVEVSNVTFNDTQDNVPNNQIVGFTGPSAFLEFTEGVALVTGNAPSVLGSLGGWMIDAPITNDPDLVQLMGNGGIANHCAILEFDFVPNFEYLSVGYVFASNEYPSFTCSSYNDIFGFFVSGPGINGPFSNDAVNIAVIPYTDIPVGINTINSGSPSGGYSESYCLLANPNYVQDSIYFVNNNPMALDDIPLSGFTVNLYANYILQPGETYHIKLAIANAMDTGVDSAVFLEGASFSAFPLSSVNGGNNPPVMVKVFPNPAGDEVSVEVTTQDPKELQIRIVDAMGKVALSNPQQIAVQKQHLQQLDISALSQGTYFLEVTDTKDSKRYITQFQKTR